MSTAAVSASTPEPKPQMVPALSPPDSNSSLKIEGSDSELSDLEGQEPGEKELVVEPSYYDGTVPVFEPNMEDFSDFQRYVRTASLPKSTNPH